MKIMRSSSIVLAIVILLCINELLSSELQMKPWISNERRAQINNDISCTNGRLLAYKYFEIKGTAESNTNVTDILELVGFGVIGLDVSASPAIILTDSSWSQDGKIKVYDYECLNDFIDRCTDIKCYKDRIPRDCPLVIPSKLYYVFKNLTKLYIDGAQSLSPLLFELKQLTSLRIHNSPVSMDSVFRYLLLPAQLTELRLTNNELSTIDSKGLFQQLTNLQIFDLRNNKLATIPNKIKKLTNLTELDLSNNRLSSVSPIITALCKLRSLLLYKNVLTLLPTDMVYMTGLQELCLNWPSAEDSCCWSIKEWVCKYPRLFDILPEEKLSTNNEDTDKGSSSRQVLELIQNNANFSLSTTERQTIKIEKENGKILLEDNMVSNSADIEKDTNKIDEQLLQELRMESSSYSRISRMEIALLLSVVVLCGGTYFIYKYRSQKKD